MSEKSLREWRGLWRCSCGMVGKDMCGHVHPEGIPFVVSPYERRTQHPDEPSLRKRVEALRDVIKGRSVVVENDYVEGRIDECGDVIKKLDALLAASPAAPVEGELRTVVHADWCKHGPELMSAHGGYIRHPNYPCTCDKVHARECEK